MFFGNAEPNQKLYAITPDYSFYIYGVLTVKSILREGKAAFSGVSIVRY